MYELLNKYISIWKAAMYNATRLKGIRKLRRLAHTPISHKTYTRKKIKSKKDL